jgi:hypothetical protein
MEMSHCNVRLCGVIGIGVGVALLAVEEPPSRASIAIVVNPSLCSDSEVRSCIMASSSLDPTGYAKVTLIGVCC